MPNSSETTATKCFSSILSRLLCSGGLPTHPSEHFIESNTIKLKTSDPRSDENAKWGPSPGVVARLMGLESFPAAAPPKERTLGDFFIRSRSVNSIDFLSHLDPTKHGSRRHRRVRTSVSFREGMSDEYASVVLLLEEELQGMMEEERREKKKNVKKSEIQEKGKSVCGKKVEKIRGGGREVSRKFVAGEGFEKKGLKERRLKKRCEEETLKKRGKKTKVLDHKLNCDFKKIQNGSTASEKARGASSRKKQPSQKAKAAICESVEVRPIIAEKNEKKTKINENGYYTKKMVDEICRLNEEVVRENWIDYGREVKFEDFEDLCQLFGQEILEGLLRQFVDDLVLHFGQQIKVG